MELGLKNRSVLITGGSKGIGLACARAFLDEGARVAIVARDRGNLDKAGAQLGKITLIAADLTQAEEAKRMAREAEAALGPIDVLVNSAGAAKRYPPDELNAHAWHAAMDDRIREALELEAKARGTTAEQVLEQGQAREPLGRYADP